MTTPVNKFASLQIVRALAAWTVVFHHYIQLFGLETASALAALFSKYGSLGVDVFFVLSGFVMYLVARKSHIGPVTFLIDRLFRVAPIYWFYCGLIVASIYLFPRGFAYTDFNVKSLLMTAAFLPNRNPSGLGIYPVLTVGWTLNFEMFFYFALACCMAVSSRHFLKILAVAFLILPLVYPKRVEYSYIASSFKLYEFLAGALLAVVWTSPLGSVIRRHRTLSLAGGFAGILLGTGLLLILREAKLPIALAIVAFALACEQYLRPESLLVRILVRLGDESYSTYLAHCIVIGVALHFTGKHLEQAPQAATLLAIITGTWAISAWSYRWLERSSYLDTIRSMLVERICSRRQSDEASPRTISS